MSDDKYAAYKPSKEELEGRVGNLNAEQTEALKGMWDRFLKVTKHKESPIAGVEIDKDADADNKESSEKTEGEEGAGAFGSQPKDDKAKDQAAAEKEKKELAALLGTHGADAFHDEFWRYTRGENPDALMLRFLRARKWDVDRGFMMLAGAIKWRLEFDTEEIRQKGEEGLCEEEGFRIQYDKAKSYTHGTDKKGRPIVFIHVAKHIPKEQSQKALERFTVFNMETVQEMSGWREQGTLIFDMTGFGLKNMDWQCISFIVKCFEAYYPETLGLCCVHKAPFVFNAIWKILGPLLDPVVRSKVDFTNSDADLAKHIDPEHIPKGMGGQLDWQWRYDGPIEGENDMLKDKEGREKALKAYDEAAAAWEENSEKWVGGDESAEKERDVLWKRLAIRHYEADPFVRGRTVYSRDGVNVGDGTVVWKYNGGEEEVLGDSADDWRDEAGIPGKCYRHGNQTETKAIKAADEQLKAEGVEPPTAKTGKIGVALSKLTPGPSAAQKHEQATAEYEDKRNAIIEEKKEELAAEERKRAEESEAKARAEEEANAAKSSGVVASVQDAASGATAAVSSTVSNVAPVNAAPLLNKIADYVPTALGGQRLKDATQMENGEQVEAKTVEANATETKAVEA